jgi:hypothetical protein
MVSVVHKLHVLAAIILVVVAVEAIAVSQQQPAKSIPYLKLTTPRHVLPEAQKWEKNEFPHTMSVLELKRGGFRYWGWYGLNEG